MAQVTGHRMPLPLPRRWIADIMHAGRAIPTVTAERMMDVSAVAEARKQLLEPPPWVLLFTKAYALVAARRPELRRAYMPFPIPHLFQADESVASIAIERDTGASRPCSSGTCVARRAFRSGRCTAI